MNSQNIKEAKRHEKLIGKITIALLTPVVLFLFYFLAQHILQEPWQLLIKPVDQDEIIHAIPVEEEDTFNLSYIHSVSQQPVKGSFIITGEGKIKPSTTEFDSFGPGLPELSTSIQYEITSDKIIIFHDEDPRDSLRLFVSPLTKETISIDEKVLELYTHQDTPLLIEVFVSMP